MDWDEVREQHRGRTRERIVAAAVELIREHGLAAVTMSQLATRAEVSRPTLYQHFKDLDHVLAAWVVDAMGRFRSDLHAQLARSPGGLAGLEVYLRAQCAVFVGAPYGLGVTHLEPSAHGPYLRGVLDEQLGRLRVLIRDLLEQARDRGEVRADLDPALAADLVFAVVDGVRSHIAAGTLSAPRAADEVMALLRDGLR